MTSEVEEEIRLLGGGVSEPLVIQNLLERLRELETENTALAQANETQRETYERCLDEVANHVVQALLNQKDLREECIKLKKRVFDLERQNRALSDLFHQKLQRSSGSSPELHPLQVLSDSQGADLDRISVSLPLGQCGVQREEKQRSGRSQPSCRSVDAMSPFLRKKAQILEVLRRLEATGSRSGSSCTTPPMYLGGISSANGNGLRVRPDQGLDYVNGEGLTSSEHGGDEPWASCLLLAQNGWEELLKWKPVQREPPAGSPGEGGGEHLGLASGEDAQQSLRQAEGSSSSSDDDIGDPPPPCNEIRQRLPLTDLTKGLAPCMCSRGAVDKRGPIEGYSDGTGYSRGHTGHLHSLTCYSRSLRDMAESQHVPVTPPAVTERGDSLSSSPGKQSISENASDGPSSSCPPSPEAAVSLPRDGTIFSHKNAVQEQQDDCPQPSMVVSNPTCPDPEDALIPSSEPQTPHIPSPAKFLKFLKLPGSGDKLQNPNSLRLSPQLTQTSKIPCRSNNYEAFPSPRLSRKANEELAGPETDNNPPSPSEFNNSDANRQGQTERSNNLINRPGIQCYTKKSHDYENVPAKNTVLPTANQTEDLDLSPKLIGEVCSSNCSPGPCVHSQANSSDDHNGQINTPFIRKHVTSRKPTESAGPLPFKERIGKPRSSDSQQSELTVAVTDENRVIPDGPDIRPMKRSLGVSSLRTPEPGSTESYPPRYHGQKSDSARSRQTVSNCQPGSPHGPRNQSRAPPVPSKSPRSPHGSPTKLPAKSPSKATAKPLVSRPLSEELRPSPRQPTLPNDEKQRMQSPGAGKKSSTCPDYACPRSPGSQGTENLPLSVLHSAIEEKVMKGIKENMLRLQEQHRAPVPDPKQRNSSGIASWFGLKKSKLPALSRRPEATRVKDEKRERAASGSPRTRDTKGESLNISMLMEKAEDLRKALQEERAYINGLSLDKNRTAISIDQTLETSRSLTADHFMQQLLNRVDGKEVPAEGRVEGKAPLRDFPRLSPENKEQRPFRSPRNGMVAHVQRCEQKSMDQKREIVLPPDERISESITSEHFAACDSLTRTLDSGIGTFPPPDYCGGTPNKNTPKLKPRLDSPSVLPVGRFSAFPKAPRRARTLERDLRGVEEMFPSGQHQSVPAFHALLAEPEPAISHRMFGEDSNRERSLPQQGKNWTFPNSKVSAGSTENFRSRAHELEEIPSEGDRDCDMSGYPHSSLCFPSSRTPSTSEVGDEGTSEAKSRDNEQGQTGLENSESLSDSLYDSLSSCGSQG
ncbi:nck-associated protein 5-like isoform X1 [Bufo gargarizans]|uniref:nck-associated protein 5-like isoform X1 n=1 Tax=Bufo gargarizans TaxID=30331 RepID=UPI001CF0E9D1|nr:nck-associated protein 5-like isoform X1 [Bufo gargarizans]XP_044143065.1 nck-associated protein 5-like isoform X1 [Bufo gargarizans]XP_044143066.1 nck-associated protein 5-like isoform X1 [Bufo gargarizans]